MIALLIAAVALVIFGLWVLFQPERFDDEYFS